MAEIRIFRDRRHIISAVVLVTALIFDWKGALALWAPLSDTDLIETSDLIVVGTLSKRITARDPADGRIQTIGVIDVDEILKGDRATKTVRLALPALEGPVSSSDITYKIGQKGLWFLRLLAPKEAEIYTADHPQRFVPFANAGPRIEAIRKRLEL